MLEKKLFNGYKVYALSLILFIGLLSFIGTRVYDAVQAMPEAFKDYVTIERYTYDQESLQNSLNRIERAQVRQENKIDKLILMDREGLK